MGSDITVLKPVIFERTDPGEGNHHKKEGGMPERPSANYGLNEKDLRVSLDQLKEKGYVAGYSFISSNLNTLVKDTSSSAARLRIRNSKGDTLAPQFFGVETDFLDSIESKYFYLDSKNSKHKYVKTIAGKDNIVKKMNEICTQDPDSWT